MATIVNAVQATIADAKSWGYVRDNVESVHRPYQGGGGGCCNDFLAGYFIGNSCAGGGGGKDDGAVCCIFAGALLLLSSIITAGFAMKEGYQFAGNLSGRAQLIGSTTDGVVTQKQVRAARQMRHIMIKNSAGSCLGLSGMAMGLAFLSVAAAIYALYVKNATYSFARVVSLAQIGGISFGGGLVIFLLTKLNYTYSDEPKIEQLMRDMSKSQDNAVVTS